MGGTPKQRGFRTLASTSRRLYHTCSLANSSVQNKHSLLTKHTHADIYLDLQCFERVATAPRCPSGLTNQF